MDLACFDLFWATSQALGYIFSCALPKLAGASPPADFRLAPGLLRSTLLEIVGI